ncbi:MAG: hypothetical protein K6D02_04305 [Lachnospiraceae bacterium]|nr:hypothetical protein [Lachnospiraceae bacterium]
MFDIHTHILPGIDDGSKSLEVTRQMLEIMEEEGITSVMATPHYDMGRNRQDINKIRELAAKVSDMISKDFPSMELYTGCEILYSAGIIEDIDKGRIPMLADTKCCLVEFYPEDSFKTIRNAVRDLINEGLTPIIAHAERYECLYEDLERVYVLIKEGAYIQINTASFEGGLFSKTRKFVMKLLKANMVHFVGSDCHDTEDRRPKMKKCYEIIKKAVGERAAKAITEENAKLIVSGKYL